jgi:hypothetical protein
MMTFSGKIKIWNDFENNENIEISLPNLESPKTLYSFLYGDIQFSEASCNHWIEAIANAQIDPDYYCESFGNCCTIYVNHNGIKIENEYTQETCENIQLDSMKIILESWLQYIQSREAVEYSW